MIIAQLLPNMRRAGAESVVALLCKGLADAGGEVHLVVLGGKFEYGEELNDRGIKVHLLGLHNGPVNFYRFDIRRRISKHLLAFLEQLSPHILHCHMPHGLIWAAAAASRLGLKTFYTIHSIDPAMNGRGLKAWWRRREFAKAVKVSDCRLLAVSGSAARQMENGLGLAPHSIPVQPNPLDLEKWKPPLDSKTSDPLTIIMVGTLYQLKRVNIGIQALKILLDTLPASKLIIAGDGPERQRLEKLALSEGLAGHVSFLGVRPDIPKLLQTAGVMWLLSEREGMPMVLLEAMASGLPVIATDVPGINELIKEGDNGLLVPMDAPFSVAAATLRLWNDPQLRESLRMRGIAFINQFDLTNIVSQHLRRYAN